jgi:hypothetical protein
MADEYKVVATGIWLYDKIVPTRITIHAMPARDSNSRRDDDYQFDDSKPIPETRDGFLYFCAPEGGDEFLTIEDAKAWADAQPWGPVKWD